MSENEQKEDPTGSQKEPLDLAVSKIPGEEEGDDSEVIQSNDVFEIVGADPNKTDETEAPPDPVDEPGHEPMDVDMDDDSEVSGYFPNGWISQEVHEHSPDMVGPSSSNVNESEQSDGDTTPPQRPSPPVSPSCSTWMNEDRDIASQVDDPKFSSESDSDSDEDKKDEPNFRWWPKARIQSEPGSPVSEDEHNHTSQSAPGKLVNEDINLGSIFLSIKTKKKENLSVVIEKPSRPEYLKNCEKCGENADFVCQGCYRVAYCGEEHQMEEWESHRQACLHYSLDRHLSLVFRGPFYVDEKNPGDEAIKSYELKSKIEMYGFNHPKLLEEKPFLICPWPKARLHSLTAGKFLPPGLIVRYLSCFGCGKVLGFSHVRCKDCKLFLCSRTCLYISHHRENECKILQQLYNNAKGEKAEKSAEDPRLNLKKIYDGSIDSRFLYYDVMILRFILKLGKMQESLAPEKFQEEWCKLQITWKSNPIDQNKHLVLSRDLAFSYAATNGNSELITKLYSILKMNSFVLELPFRRFRALCIVISAASHSCSPTCQVYLNEPGVEKLDVDQMEEDPNDMTVVLKPADILHQGESLTFSYVPLTLGTLQRQEMLMNDYGIICMCLRCIDVTECGTYCTNIKCSQCATGVMIPNWVYGEPTRKPMWVCRPVTGIERRNRCDRPYSGGCVLIDDITAKNKCMSLEGLLFELTTKPNYASVYKRVLTSYKIGNTYQYYSQILKFCEDILRGDFLALPDILADDLSDFNDETLSLILKAKQIYGNFMEQFISRFAFEGFPVANYELIENELQGRRQAKQSSTNDTCIVTAQNIHNVLRSRRGRPHLSLASIPALHSA